MARTPIEHASLDAEESHQNQVFQADGAEKITLPGTEFISDATMTRDGQDLILETSSGETVVIEGYFSADPAPLLISADGAALTPELVNAFAKSPLEFAANPQANDESPVGAVEEVSGHATVTRADGTVETITIGTPIYQGDIVETDASGAVNIVFIDETSMAVSENARLAIEEYTFDPSTESGTTNFSVLRGLFVFTSGLIGRDDPDDVHINTPVGSIGIRGTIIAGEINPGGQSNITVLEGAIVVANDLGNVTLSQQFETVQLSGFNSAMGEVSILPANDISSRFSSISSVSPSLFTTINDAAGDQQSAPKNNAPAEQPQSQNTEPSVDQSQDIVTLNQNTISTPQQTTITSSSASASAPQSGSTTQVTTVGTAAPQPFLSPKATPPVVNLTPLELSFHGGTLKDTAQAGDIIGRVIVTGALPAALTYSFANGDNVSANGYFELDGAFVKLTSAGAAALGQSLDVVQLGGFGIKVSTPSGRNAMLQQDVTVVDANNATNSTHMNWSHNRVVILSDTLENQAGYSISALGDINNDGFDDFIFTNNTSATGQNHTYIMLGGATQLLPATTLSGYSGLTTIQNPTSSVNASETMVHGIGDFDGDGVEDYVIGQPNNMAGSATGSGNFAIVSGNDPAKFTLFTGHPSSGSMIGQSVSGIGDLNNDGYADVIIGAPNSESGNGAAYVIHGGTTWTNINPSSLSGNVEKISGSGGFGTVVTGIGDFNGDGYNDFAVGAPGANSNAGSVTLYYGSKNGLVTGGTISETGSMTYGLSILNLGDVNGDGKTDIMVSGKNASYIYFGGNATSGSPDVTFNTSYDDYEIVGAGAIGDFNGDGFDDFALSLGDDNGVKTYVIYGGRSINGADLSYLKNPENAFEIQYSGANKDSEIRISSIGDINGDGYDDFAMGLPDANGSAAGDGGLAIIYGRNTGSTASGNTATEDRQSFVGGAGHDQFSDGGFVGTSMRGGSGNDTFQIKNANFLGIDGGSGTADRIWIESSIDFSNVHFEKISGIEMLQFGDANLTMTLTLENIFNLLKTSDNGTLKIDSTQAGSILNIDAGTTSAGSNVTNAHIETALNEMGSNAHSRVSDLAGYRQFNIGGYDLYIADNANLTVNVV